MATVNDKFKVKHGLQVSNGSNDSIISADNTNIEFYRHTKIIGTDETSTPLVLLSHPLQEANLQEWLASDFSVLARMDEQGHLFTQKVTTDSDVVIGGNLTVNGTTTTIHSIIATVDDPVILLGGDTPPTQYDGKFRGVEFRWHDGVEAHTGFFGYESVNGRFVYIPDATNEGEIFTGTLGDANFKNGFFSGRVEIDGGELTSNSTLFNLLPTIVENLYLGASATYIEIGATTGTTKIRNSANVVGDLTVDGGDIVSTTATTNLINTTSTTVNFAGAATDIQIGSSTGTTNVNNNLDVDGDVNVDGGDFTTSSTAFNLINSNAETVNFAGAATSITMGALTGTTTIRNNVDISGNELSSTSSSFTLLDTPTTVNFAGAATDIQIGSSTGTTNINNNLDVDGDVNIDGGDLTVSTSTFNLANSNATTVNFAGSATSVNIGASTGTTNVKNNLEVDGDITVDGGDIVSTTSTLNIANTNSTTINFGGAATDIQIGSATGTTEINNGLNVVGNVNIDGGNLIASTDVFNLINTNAETINFGGVATDIQIGSASGITNVNNNLDVDGDVNVDGGSITSNLTNFNLLKENVQVLDFAQTATNITMGADTGTTTIRHNLTVQDVLTIQGSTTNFSPPTAGTPPFTVGANAFDVLVAGLNADKLDGQTGTWYQARENHTGTQLNTTISNWTEAVNDTVAPMFVHSQQSGIVAQYNDETGRILLTVAGGGGTGEAVDFGLLYWMGV